MLTGGGPAASSAASACLLVTGPAPPGDGWLTLEERQVQARLRVPKRRADWRLGRWAAKQAAQALGLARTAQAVEVRASRGGAPELWLEGARWPGTLSLSHAHDRALAALRPDGGPLGADVEQVEERTAGFVEDYFTASEQRAWRMADPRAQALLATLLWSAKESALKALGEGLRLATGSVEVHVSPPVEGLEGWQALQVRPPDGASSLWPGFWRRDGPDLLTVVGPGLERPPRELARGGRAMAGRQPATCGR